MRKTPKELSSEYYQFVNSFTQTSFEDEKMLGKRRCTFLPSDYCSEQ